MSSRQPRWMFGAAIRPAYFQQCLETWKLRSAFWSFCIYLQWTRVSDAKWWMGASQCSYCTASVFSRILSSASKRPLHICQAVIKPRRPSPDSNWVYFGPSRIHGVSQNHEVARAAVPRGGETTNRQDFQRPVFKFCEDNNQHDVLCSSPAALSSLELSMCAVQCDASQFSGHIESTLHSNAFPVFGTRPYGRFSFPQFL